MDAGTDQFAVTLGATAAHGAEAVPQRIDHRTDFARADRRSGRHGEVDARHEIAVGVGCGQRLRFGFDAFKQNQRTGLVNQADDLRQQAAGGVPKGRRPP